MRVPAPRSLRLCFAWLWCWAWWPSQAHAEEEFAWPLALEHALSSTFGETRTTAFHAGIDLRTQGKTGFEVHAPAAGYLWKARTSPWGYGRSLYQKLPDGRILVYAHLQGFAPPIAARVARAQREKQTYSVDLEFKPGEIPIKRGQLVAWSGDSGIGPPHLHIELRDAENIPLNPLLHGFQVEDTLAPVFERLALVPMGIDSQVDGSHQPICVALRGAADRYEAEDTLLAAGSFGVSVLLYDQADKAPNQLAPYRLRLYVDGKPQLTSTYARVSYLDGHQVFLDRLRLEFPGGSGVFFNLFRLRGNRLEFYDLPPGADGFVRGLAKGPHELVVQAEDAAGNLSQAHLWVQVDELPRIADFQLHPAGNTLTIQAQVDDPDDDTLDLELAWSADGSQWQRELAAQVRPGPCQWEVPARPGIWRLRARDEAGGEDFKTCALEGQVQFSLAYSAFPDFAEVQLTTDRPLTSLPQLRFADAQRQAPLLLRQYGPQEYRASLQFSAAGGPLTIQMAGQATPTLVLLQQQVNPGQEAQVQWDGGEARLHLGANSAYAPFFPQARRFTPPATAGLEPARVGYDFTPAGLSFDQQVEVSLRYAPTLADPQKLGLYQERGAGEWFFVGNQLDTAQHLVGGKVRRLLRFALFSDTQAPSITALQPAAGTAVKERQPLLRAQVGDEGSGIGREEDLTLRLDGGRLIAEYDPEAGTLSAQPDAPLKTGRHRWEVEVRDQSGNQAAARAEFTVR